MTVSGAPGHDTQSARDVRTLTVDGRTVAYVEYGDPDGDPALFLHGMPGSRLLAGLITESRLTGRPWDVALDAVDCHARLWHGKRDGNVPVTATRRLAMRLPDTELTVADEADHLGALLHYRSAVLDTVATDD